MGFGISNSMLRKSSMKKNSKIMSATVVQLGYASSEKWVNQEVIQ